MQENHLLQEPWEVIRQWLPEDLEHSARVYGAFRRARGEIQSAATLLRLILMHVAGGLSLEQTVMRAQEQGLVTISAVALFKRLRSAGSWLSWLTAEMVYDLSRQGDASGWGRRRVRILDATDIQEPGPTGTDWRLHYCLRLPQMSCDFLELTDQQGGESLRRLPVGSGDIVLVDRGYSHRSGVAQVIEAGAEVVVRLNPPAFPLEDETGRRLDWVRWLKGLQVGRVREWKGWFSHAGQRYGVRLCAVRKTEAAAVRAQRKAKRKSRKNGHRILPETLVLAQYVIVLTTLSATWGSTHDLLELYRGRWQVELVFKRLKSLLAVGHVPKTTDPSSRAWMQAKILTALLIERLIQEGRFFSPGGCRLRRGTTLARV